MSTLWHVWQASRGRSGRDVAGEGLSQPREKSMAGFDLFSATQEPLQRHITLNHGEAVQRLHRLAVREGQSTSSSSLLAIVYT